MSIKIIERTVYGPKVQELAKRLGIPQAQAEGHMLNLFTWVFEKKCMGELGYIPESEIARNSKWQGDADIFMQKLRTCRILRWSENRGYWLHEWKPTYGVQEQKAEHAKEMHRLRQKKYISKKLAKTNDQKNKKVDVYGSDESLSRLTSLNLNIENVPKIEAKSNADGVTDATPLINILLSKIDLMYKELQSLSERQQGNCISVKPNSESNENYEMRCKGCLDYYESQYLPLTKYQRKEILGYLENPEYENITPDMILAIVDDVVDKEGHTYEYFRRVMHRIAKQTKKISADVYRAKQAEREKVKNMILAKQNKRSVFTAVDDNPDDKKSDGHADID